MTKIGLVLMLVCAIAGGISYSWNSQDKPVPVTVAPTKPKVVTEKNKRGDVDFGPYMADLQRRIKLRWFPPKADETDKVQLVFKVHSNGTMSNLHVTKASKSAAGNQAARNAIQKASPFRPLPKGSPSSVDIQFTFDYNVFTE